MEQHVKVSLSTDSDGFTSQECPSCHRVFKVVFGEGSGRPIGFCPYCGHAGQGCWWTQQQADYLTGVAGEKLVGPILDEFARDMKRLNRPGSLISFDVDVKRGSVPRQPLESEAIMAIVTFGCCGERLKHDGSQSQLHCIICSQLNDVA